MGDDSPDAQQAYRLSLLQSIATLPSMGVSDLLRAIADAAAAGLGPCEAGIWLVDTQSSDGCLLILLQADGSEIPLGSARARPLARIPLGGVYGEALSAGRIISISDARQDPRMRDHLAARIEPLAIGALLIAPMRTGARVLGVVAVQIIGRTRTWSHADELFAASLADLGALGLVAAELRESNARLAEQARRAEAADKAKLAFLGSMNHLTRTPLNAIIGFGELLQSDPTLSASQRQFAAEIVGGGRDLLRMVEKVVGYAQLASDDRRPARRAVRVGALLHGVLDAVRLAARGSGRDPLLVGNMDEVVLVDPDLLATALRELLDNALRHSGHDAPAEIGFGREASGGCRFWVSDGGPGMTQRSIEGSVEPFGHLPADWAAPVSGTGLGLPLARRCIALQGGQLRLRGTMPRGTIAEVLLPPGE